MGLNKKKLCQFTVKANKLDLKKRETTKELKDTC